MATETFTTSGTWTCPQGVTSVKVEIRAPGGGSGGSSESYFGTGGAAGGQYVRKNSFSVTPGNSYTVHIGASGTAGSSSGGNGTAGGVTYFSSNDSNGVVAQGGAGSYGNDRQGVSGSTNGGIGDVIYAGGNGADSPGYNQGGGGGGGGNSDGTGTSGSGTAGGATGDGGNGGTGATNGPGQNGGNYGGGAGGCGCNTSGRPGGNGGAGCIILTYIGSSPSSSTSVSPSVSPSSSISPSTSISVSPSSSISASLSTSSSPSLSPSTSISVSPSLSESQSSSISPSISESLSSSSSISASLSPSISASISPSTSQSNSPSTSISQSPSISASVSVSASPSQPETTSLLIDYWNVTLLGSISPSLSPSISPSLSKSISPSISESISPSISASISISVSPSISESSSISASISPSLSESISPSISESISPSLSVSVSPSLSPSISVSVSPSISASTSVSVSPSVSPSASPSPPPARLLYKVYQEDGTFVETLNDVISDISITKEINGGDGPFTITLARKIDDFGEGTDIDFNYRVKVYLFDSFNPTGKLIANGYIISYEPYLNGNEEGLTITCLSAISKLSNDYYRLGTSAVASELGVELADMRADEMMTSVVNHYRSIETNSMIGAPSGLTQTTDNAGNLFDFTLRLFNKKHLEALKEIAKYFARYKSNGYWFYWRINTAGNLEVKNISQTATHKFTIGKNITSISGQKTIEGLVNRVYFWNEKGTTSSEYLKLTTDDTDSQNEYDIVSEYINDSSVTNATAAGLLSSARVYDNKDPKVKIKIELNSDYDLSSIEPGQTCQIFNLKNNPYKLGEDKVLFIHSITYEVDKATLEIAEAADDFTDMVEEERNRLTDELTWFGYISQDITAAQLGPADRTWSTDISFTASSDADAYRKMTWTSGSVYLATSVSSSAGKRVIAAGNTGLMSAGQDYYIYLNEDTINISASVDVTGTGVIKQGEEYLYDTSKSWSTNQWQGYIVTIGGQTRVIRSNTATVLSLEQSWTIADTTDTYNIRKWTFDVTTSKSAVASSSNVIFGTTRATANTASQASVVTENASSTTNFTFDGTENIAERSITYHSIKANTITANEINTGAISIGVWGGSLDDVDNGSTYYKTTANQVTGAGRAYYGLNSSNRPAVGILSSDLSAISLPGSFTGSRIDSNGIYGYYSGVPTFYLRNSDGAFYAQGTIQSGATGDNVVLSNNSIYLRYGTSINATLNTNYFAGGYGFDIFTGNDISEATYIRFIDNYTTPATSNLEFGISGLSLFTMDVYGLTPSSNNSFDLGGSSYYFRDLYLYNLRLHYQSSGTPAAGTIINWHTATADQFRGTPGTGAWTGSFDMTAV